MTDNYKFITFGGDGGTYDIGFQSLSGAMERGHNMTYVCYDNGAYMNTGIQRSSATPQYADTTTSATGSCSNGKTQTRKEPVSYTHLFFFAMRGRKAKAEKEGK